MIKKIISLLFVLSMVLFSQNAKNIFDAINNNDLSSVKKIIMAGGNVNAINKSGMTALIVASEKGNIEIVRELINAGANVNGANSVGWTALMGASFEGNAEVVKELINSGANINAFGIKYKNTALMQAIRGENPEIVKILVDSGADINMKNANGETAYDKAMEVGLTEVAELLKPKPENSNIYIDNISTNTKVIIMIIIVLIMLVINILIYRFGRYSESGELIRKIFAWGPLIFSILYIIINIISIIPNIMYILIALLDFDFSFIDGVKVFKCISFLLWAIANAIHYGISENFNVSDCFNISIEVIKYIALGIGLFIVLTGGGVTIKVIFIIALILFIVILAILFVFGFAFQGLLMICNCGMAAAEFVIAIIYTNLKDIIGYLKNKYPNASSVAIKDKKKLSKQAAKKLGIKDRLESNPNLYVGKGLLLGNNNEIVGEEEVIFDSSVPIEVGETYTL